jgi:hypothetical protein
VFHDRLISSEDRSWFCTALTASAAASLGPDAADALRPRPRTPDAAGPRLPADPSPPAVEPPHGEAAAGDVSPGVASGKVSPDLAMRMPGQQVAAVEAVAVPGGLRESSGKNLASGVVEDVRSSSEAAPEAGNGGAGTGGSATAGGEGRPGVVVPLDSAHEGGKPGGGAEQAGNDAAEGLNGITFCSFIGEVSAFFCRIPLQCSTPLTWTLNRESPKLSSRVHIEYSWTLTLHTACAQEQADV